LTRIIGLDIGSRTVDAVWLEHGSVVDSCVVDSGYDPQEVCAGLIARGDHDLVVATSYGRHAAVDSFGGKAVTEISAYARGAVELFPGVRSVLDIGGQDTKVMIVSDEGRLVDFEMNDKCAAGTGRFLEVMAGTLGFELGQIGDAALGADAGIKISAMCTVFAESEVTTLVHRGEDRGRIALGLHEAVVSRTLSMLKRLQVRPPLVFAGGGAKNRALVELLRREFGGVILVPDSPQIVGALGAALLGVQVSSLGRMGILNR
jgi:predicted CoA-substrate-specific enzyme activase